MTASLTLIRSYNLIDFLSNTTQLRIIYICALLSARSRCSLSPLCAALRGLRKLCQLGSEFVLRPPSFLTRVSSFIWLGRSLRKHWALICRAALGHVKAGHLITEKTGKFGAKVMRNFEAQSLNQMYRGMLKFQYFCWLKLETFRIWLARCKGKASFVSYEVKLKALCFVVNIKILNRVKGCFILRSWRYLLPGSNSVCSIDYLSR